MTCKGVGECEGAIYASIFSFLDLVIGVMKFVTYVSI
jgi:hypothetical protein